jgi:flagellar biosynthesis protein FliQ
MSELLELATREGASLVLTLLLPVLVVAFAAAIAAGWLSAALGVRDAALGQSIRALVVLLVLGLLADRMAETMTAYARSSWGSLADLHESSEEPRR